MAKRKRYTYQDVKNIVENENYELISTENEIIDEKGFVKTSTKITVWCKNENHNYIKPQLSKFLKGGRCGKCRNDNKKFDYKYVKEYVESFGYKLLSKEYKNNSTDLLIECPLEHKFKMIFNNFKKGQRCPKCGEIKRREKRTIWNKEKIINFVKNSNYEFIKFVKFDKLNSRILIKCNNKKHESYEVTFANFKNGKRCPYCSNHVKFDYKYVKEYIESFGYKLLSKEYKNTNEYILIKCPDENHKPYLVKFSSFKNQETRCPYCQNKKRGLYRKFDYKYVKEYVESFGYKLLSKEYKNCDEKLKIECNKGHIYEVSFYCFKNLNTRCPICNESKGEIKIREILNKYDIKFTPQKKYSKLIGIKGRQLSYDFYLPLYNTLIEYQGEYHDGTGYNQTKEKFETQKEHDKRKRNYAKDNNIKLLEIWYYDFDNIENILIKELNLK